MTEQKSSGSKLADGGGSSLVVIEQTAPDSRQKSFRHEELKEETEKVQHRKDHKAPGVPNVIAEDIKSKSPTQDTDVVQKSQNHPTEIEHKSSKTPKVVKKSPSSNKKQPSLSEAIAMTPIETDVKKNDDITTRTSSAFKPIPLQVENIASKMDEITTDNTADSDGKDRIELEWAEDEDAGAVPRSDSRSSRTSRASRVTRTVKHLFCCGATYEAPSEEDVAEQRDISGI